MSKIIFGNWKLNPRTLEEALDLFSKIDFNSKNEVVVCAPTVFLGSLKGGVLGAQDVFTEQSGAYSGAVGAFQLKSVGASYCLVGHSEVRKRGESLDDRRLKLKCLLEANLVPVICVGYGVNSDTSIDSSLEMILEELDDLSGNLGESIIAFEPEWALSTSGSNVSVDSEKMSEMISLVVEGISTKYENKIIYGGSVSVENVEKYINIEGISGLLVGGNSLKAEVFNKIVSV
jgi:triosephosphate isomerase